ncbi:recombinase family protein, partial [Eubacterium aggregans]|uniref:recombinase family protein n=1 Tax=Eubacterium aggregans TaxID=81409 RepID=UPI003F37C1C0
VIMEQLDASKVFIEKLSGKDTNRPQLKAMLDYVRKGDTVVVESYSRLARSTKDLLSIVDELSSKGVQFISQKENIDTTTPQGRLMLTIFAGLAQFERECMLERQLEGIAIAKAEGKYKGRQPIKVDMEQFGDVYQEWKAGAITARKAMETLGLKPNTFYRRVKEYESSKGAPPVL